MTKFLCAVVYYLECGDIEATVYTTEGKLELVNLDPLHAFIIEAIQRAGSSVRDELVLDGSIRSVTIWKL